MTLDNNMSFVSMGRRAVSGTNDRSRATTALRNRRGAWSARFQVGLAQRLRRDRERSKKDAKDKTVTSAETSSLPQDLCW